MDLNGPDQPSLGPLPTYVLPLGPRAQFQLSPGQLVPAWPTPQECQAQALSLALSPAVIYCSPCMNPIPVSSPHLVWWLLTVHRTCHCYQHGLAPMLWDCALSVRSPASRLPFAPSSSSFVDSLPLPLPGNCNYAKSTLKWNTFIKSQTLEKKKCLCCQFKRKLSCTFNMQARELLWHLQILQTA